MRALAVLACFAMGSCTPKPPPAKPPVTPEEPPGRQRSMVTSFVVVNECPDSPKMSSKQAAKEIDELVGPCTSVPGGGAHFSAILLPDGRVELASPAGDPSAGVVPTCVVQTATQLRHKVKLKSPCKFDVKLEERKAH
jgi:hypothetical protein